MVEYWEETIHLLQPATGVQLVTKPHLKPDLLQKVPFKFLHDVITAILKKTNFAAGLYSDQHLDRKWEGFDKDKVGKDANQNRRKFLSDMLMVVSHSLDEDIHCDVKEVLRGRNPEGANKLLQNLAKAAHILQLDGSEAVQVLKKRADGHVDAEAQRPESRRAPKPFRVAEAQSADISALRKTESGIPLEAAKIQACEALDPLAHEGSMANGAADLDSISYMSHKHAVANPPVACSRAAHPSRSAASASPQQTADDHSTEAMHGPTDAIATSSTPPVRPLTAKKAPPPAALSTQVKQHTRLRPPQEMVASAARQGVHVYHEEHADGDDLIDVVETGQSAIHAHPKMAHGILVNEIYKVKDTVDASQMLEQGDSQSIVEGIHLGRTRRSKQRTGSQVDFRSIQQAVEQVVQQITPLAKTMEYLQEDKENMKKELQVWRSEAERWGEQLAEEKHTWASLDKTPLTTLDDQIQKRKVSIGQIKRRILSNDDRIAEMLNLVIGDT
eukprot:jgi/Ulvmu1/3219/UM015_0260.1